MCRRTKGGQPARCNKPRSLFCRKSQMRPAVRCAWLARKETAGNAFVSGSLRPPRPGKARCTRESKNVLNAIRSAGCQKGEQRPQQPAGKRFEISSGKPAPNANKCSGHNARLAEQKHHTAKNRASGREPDASVFRCGCCRAAKPAAASAMCGRVEQQQGKQQKNG